MKELDWQENRKLDRLAELKAQIKPLEAEAKEIMEYFNKKYDSDQLPNPYLAFHGKLCLTVRPNWTEVDNLAIIKILGQANFIKYATITASKVKDAGGELALDKAIEAGAVKKKAPSVYYTLKA